MNKRFDNRTLNSKISDAVKISDELLSPGSKMLNEIRAKNDWGYNSGTGEEIYQKIVTSKVVAPVFMYRAWFWSKALGYSDSTGIYINSRKIDSFSVSDLVGLLTHEISHQMGFNHGSNYPSDDKNLRSLPYFISFNISRWL